MVPRRIDDALETARFAFAALPVPPERPTRFATDGSKAENHVATVLDAGKAVPSADEREPARGSYIGAGALGRVTVATSPYLSAARESAQFPTKLERSRQANRPM